jgi:hypothetical protein
MTTVVAFVSQKGGVGNQRLHELWRARLHKVAYR